MKGNCLHEFWISNVEDSSAKAIYFGEAFKGPTVCMANNDDNFYWQGFENWSEVNEFIEELKRTATKAFGDAL